MIRSKMTVPWQLSPKGPTWTISSSAVANRRAKSFIESTNSQILGEIMPKHTVNTTFAWEFGKDKIVRTHKLYTACIRMNAT